MMCAYNKQRINIFMPSSMMTKWVASDDVQLSRIQLLTHKRQQQLKLNTSQFSPASSTTSSRSTTRTSSTSTSTNTSSSSGRRARRRHRRAAMLRRATDADRKWNLPITYMINSSFSGRKTPLYTIDGFHSSRPLDLQHVY